jgi:hypothetical protein
MFGSGFLAVLAAAVQNFLIDGIMGWLTQLFGAIFPSA